MFLIGGNVDLQIEISYLAIIYRRHYDGTGATRRAVSLALRDIGDMVCTDDMPGADD